MTFAKFPNPPPCPHFHATPLTELALPHFLRISRTPYIPPRLQTSQMEVPLGRCNYMSCGLDVGSIIHVMISNTLDVLEFWVNKRRGAGGRLWWLSLCGLCKFALQEFTDLFNIFTNTRFIILITQISKSRNVAKTWHKGQPTRCDEQRHGSSE